ncbi:MAG: hypothetical protein NT154_18120, partial [Verrucomicrobia bacterium]|nr:hypothetical protein [Verrucomicrobiota bacterium]
MEELSNGGAICLISTRAPRHDPAMQKRVHMGFAVVLLALAGVTAWLVWRAREPVYQGEPLSFWLEGNELNSMNSGQIDALVREIGTNALPNLLRMLRAKDSPLRLKLMRFAQR